MACGMTAPMQKALDRVRAGEDDPPCRDCGGILKSATISFGQALVPEVIERALRSAAEADLFLAIGTSLQVYPIAGAVEIASSVGARDRDPECGGDAVRRHRGCGDTRADWGGAAGTRRGVKTCEDGVIR